MTPAAPPRQAQAPQVPRMEGTTGRSMWLGVLRGPLVIAVLFAVVLAFGSSFDVYDLTRPEGLDVLARLTEQSDVVLTNALPEASARLGIDYASSV